MTEHLPHRLRVRPVLTSSSLGEPYGPEVDRGSHGMIANREVTPLPAIAGSVDRGVPVSRMTDGGGDPSSHLIAVTSSTSDAGTMKPPMSLRKMMVMQLSGS